MSARYLREASSEQVVNRVSRILAGDNQLVNGSIIQRVLDPAVRVNDWGHNVYGPYHADMKPPDYLGKTFAADHQHYLTTTTTTLDSIHVEAAIDHVAEHGYGVASGRFVLLMNPADVKTSLITSWRAGVEYATGKKPKFDFIVSSNAPARLTNLRVEGAAPPPDYNGLPVLGSYGKALLIESYFIPAGYVIVAATSGPNGSDNVVGFREHKNPAYHGLRVIEGPRSSYPIVEHFYTRAFGTGVRHRGAAVAIQITENASYTPPTMVVHR